MAHLPPGEDRSVEDERNDDSDGRQPRGREGRRVSARSTTRRVTMDESTPSGRVEEGHDNAQDDPKKNSSFSWDAADDDATTTSPRTVRSPSVHGGRIASFATSSRSSSGTSLPGIVSSGHEERDGDGSVFPVLPLAQHGATITSTDSASRARAVGQSLVDEDAVKMETRSHSSSSIQDPDEPASSTTAGSMPSLITPTQRDPEAGGSRVGDSLWSSDISNGDKFGFPYNNIIPITSRTATTGTTRPIPAVRVLTPADVGEMDLAVCVGILVFCLMTTLCMHKCKGFVRFGMAFFSVALASIELPQSLGLTLPRLRETVVFADLQEGGYLALLILMLVTLSLFAGILYWKLPAVIGLLFSLGWGWFWFAPLAVQGLKKLFVFFNWHRFASGFDTDNDSLTQTALLFSSRGPRPRTVRAPQGDAGINILPDYAVSTTDSGANVLLPAPLNDGTDATQRTTAWLNVLLLIVLGFFYTMMLLRFFKFFHNFCTSLCSAFFVMAAYGEICVSLRYGMRPGYTTGGGSDTPSIVPMVVPDREVFLGVFEYDLIAPFIFLRNLTKRNELYAVWQDFWNSAIACENWPFCWFSKIRTGLRACYDVERSDTRRVTARNSDWGAWFLMGCVFLFAFLVSYRLHAKEDVREERAEEATEREEKLEALRKRREDDRRAKSNKRLSHLFSDSDPDEFDNHPDGLVQEQGHGHYALQRGTVSYKQNGHGRPPRPPSGTRSSTRAPQELHHLQGCYQEDAYTKNDQDRYQSTKPGRRRQSSSRRSQRSAADMTRPQNCVIPIPPSSSTNSRAAASPPPIRTSKAGSAYSVQRK
ncbi:unnamed protein product [Amoebophrya sp. A25]|nr:unnamed protein product [Amoebophrya sp. A25]|eukprot:GSA25T00017523001.1